MNQTILPPGFDDVLTELKDSMFANFNCVQIGKLTKINTDQTCELEIQFLRTLQDGTTKKYPLLVDCPYIVIGGGGAYLDMPISKGDYCLVLFSDRNIDDWWDTANVAVPADTRKHSISDGIALVGINPKVKAFARNGDFVRLLGKSGPGNEEFAARIGDEVTVTIPAETFVVEVTGGSGSPAVGTKNPAPIDVTGTITSASGEVKIG
jgi:hypothetical protein